jgi:tRNA A-37 threonylcarbamoyl transferase component Bud32
MDETTDKLNSTLGHRYHIERMLGVGGMANVYLARDLKHDRDVAIKVMRPELTESMGSERYLREIRLLARLQHPNILGLVDSGEASGVLYYVMPYLADGSLRGRLTRERELPVATALGIFREIASALEYAHAEGVVHRDIKPENVLLSAGHALVTDFGIARIVDDSASGSTLLTTAGTTIGTPQYMAPEQVAGDSKIDHRADLYSLGVLVYELLAGIPPFAAANAAQVLAKQLTQAPDPLSRHRSAVPAALEDVVMRCLEKRAADRWQTAGELLAALDRALSVETGAIRASRGSGTVTAHLPITEAIARRLDRSCFDPRMIGDSLDYLDNRAASDVLVMLLNAAWLDGSDFEEHLRTLPYRCIAPTLYGFSPHARHRFALKLNDHLTLLSEILQVAVKENRPSLVILAGFSASGDIVLRLPSALPERARVPDAILALGANQGIETCFLTRRLAELKNDEPAKLLESLREIEATAKTLEDWLLLNSYLGRIFQGCLIFISNMGTQLSIQPLPRNRTSHRLHLSSVLLSSSV